MKNKQTNIHVQTPGFEPVTDTEAGRLIGGQDHDPHNAGTCVALGIACNNKGGIKGGVCVLYGVAKSIWNWWGCSHENTDEKKDENKEYVV